MDLLGGSVGMTVQPPSFLGIHNAEAQVNCSSVLTLVMSTIYVKMSLFIFE